MGKGDHLKQELITAQARIKKLELESKSWELTARTAGGAFRAQEEEIKQLRKELWWALATWRHMVNCSVDFSGEYAKEWKRLAKLAKL